MLETGNGLLGVGPAPAAEGLVDATAAEAVAADCRAERFDLPALERAGEERASVVVLLVAALREAVGPQVAAAVHPGRRRRTC